MSGRPAGGVIRELVRLAPTYADAPACRAPRRSVEGAAAVEDHDRIWHPAIPPGKQTAASELRSTMEARAVCRGCPALEECRDDVVRQEWGLNLTARNANGVRAGMSPRQRAALEEHIRGEGGR